MAIVYVPPKNNKAKTIKIDDIDNNFQSKDVEGALKELSEKNGSNIDDVNISDKNTFSNKKIEEKFSDVNEQFNTKANKVDLEVERQRINSLTKLGEGSTTGDAELIDGRVGANGIVYSNIGNAIRGQFNELDKITIGKNLFDKDTLKNGYYQGGILKTNNANYKHTIINMSENTKFTINNVCFINYFSKDNVFLGEEINGANKSMTYTTPTNTSYLIVSPNILYINTFQLELGEVATSFEPFHYKFKKDIEEKKDYQDGLIFFNIPVNQYTVRKGIGSLRTDNEVIVNVPAVLQLPKTYTVKGKPVPLIMICHGAGYGVTSSSWGTATNDYENSTSTFRTMIDTFISNGYAVCDINGYNADFPNLTWGCPRAVHAYRKLYEYVVKNYNVEKQINVYGFSMGGLVALNFCNENRDIVKALGLGAPVTSLYGQCWNGAYGSSKGWRKSSALAFDFENLDNVSWQYTNKEPNESELACWESNKYYTNGFAPERRIKTISGENVMIGNLPPLKVWLGLSDTAIDRESTDLFVNSVINAGNYATIRYIKGGSHGVSFGNNTEINIEFIYWFNRFNFKA